MATEKKHPIPEWGDPTTFFGNGEVPLNKKFFYVSSLDKYTNLQGDFFTEDDLQWFDRQERGWKESLEDHTLYELIQMFPEAKSVAKKNMKGELKLLKERMNMLSEWRQNCQKTINSMPFQEQKFWIKHYDEGYDESYADLERKIKKVNFNLSMLEEKKVPLGNGVTERDVQLAKEVPIVNFFTKLQKHGALATGACPYHIDKTPSFTIYLKQNTFWCYSCAYGGTVIDFIMKQRNVDFLQAVKILLNK